jgi:hypothetical protein
MHQTKLTDFTDRKDLVSDRESDQTTDDIGRQLDLFDSKVGVANVTKTNST